MRIFACLIAATVLFSSCATIISGSSKVFGIDSNPQSAHVEITNRKGVVVFRGETPVTTHLRTGAGFFTPAIYSIKVTMDGYKTQIFPVQAHINGWYFANIVIGGGIGMLIVDPATGAMYKFSNTQALIEATLSPNSTTSTRELKIIDIRDVPADRRSALVRLPG